MKISIHNRFLKFFYLPILLLSIINYTEAKIKDSISEFISNTPQKKIKISGTVYLLSKSGKQIASGATIRSKNITQLTDSNGQFSIQVEPGDPVEVSYLGYNSVTISEKISKHLTIELAADLNILEDIVVTGYTSQLKRSITGAMSSLKGKTIENVPVQSIDRAMQGQMAGVNIMAANGVPGGPVKINIRGLGSISAGNDPLIIVDGVQLNMSTISGLTASNPLAFFNNNDIDRIEVLKDGAAASIYGAQAANGVILITTKKGLAGSTKVNLNYYSGLTSPMPEVDMMNSQQFFQARFEARNNRYPNRSLERNRADVLKAVDLPEDLTDDQIAQLPTYNWQQAAFLMGKTNNADLSISGGNEKTQFFASGSFNKSDGNVVTIDFKRSTAKLNLKHQINNRISIDLNTNLGTIVQNGTTGSNESTGAYAAPQYTAPSMLPFIPLYNKDGSMNAPLEGLPGSSNRNPIQESLLGTLQSRTKSLLTNASLSFKILQNLTFKSFYGFEYRIIGDERYVDPRTRSGFASQGSLSISNRQNNNFLTNQTLHYNGFWNEKHQISGLLGFEYRYDHREMNAVSATGFTTHQFRNLQSAALVGGASGSWTGFKRAGIFSQVTYDYHKKYLANMIWRYDGSSRFGSNNYFGLFPGFSVGWNLNQEDFLMDINWVTQLKLRAGYGQTGNDDIGNFSSRALFSSTGSSSYNQLPGLRSSGLANPNLKWERNITSNVGLDYSLFNNRIHGSIELFRRISSDLLLNRPLSYLSGFSSITSNAGRVKNEGLEWEVQTTNIKKEHFTWTSNFNITFLRNKVLALADGNMVMPGNQSIRVGYALGTNVMLEYAGVNSATGRPMWYDANGEITYTPSSPDDLKIFGNQMSDFYGGFTNNFSFKGLSLSAFFHYDYGRELSNQGMHSRWFRNGGDNRNTLERIFTGRWKNPGDITSIPRPIDGNTEVRGRSHVSSSSRFLEDASFIRLKNVTMSYVLPKSWLNKIKMDHIKFYVQGENLMTWTKWTGYDPELIIGDSDFSSTQGTVPQTKAFTMGFQLGF